MKIGLRIEGFILTIFFTLILVVSPVFAASRPVWSDFCPKGLENAEYKEIQLFWPDGTKDTQSIYNYWAERRQEFEKDLAKCDALDGGLNNSCYRLLRDRQLFVNEQYQKDIRQKQITNQVWRDMHDKGSSPIMINIFAH